MPALPNRPVRDLRHRSKVSMEFLPRKAWSDADLSPCRFQGSRSVSRPDFLSKMFLDQVVQESRYVVEL